MRRFLVLVALLLIACQTVTAPLLGEPALIREAHRAATAPAGQAIPSGKPAESHTAEGTPVPTVTPAATATPEAPVGAFEVRFHPDGGLYAGDLVSMEVIAPPGLELHEDAEVVVTLGDQEIGTAGFDPYGIAGRIQATLRWAWDTSQLPAGEYELGFSIPEEDRSWTQIVTLAEPPAPGTGATWESAESDCCVIHYITGTAGARDLPRLLAEADQLAAEAREQMGIDFAEPIVVELLPRVLGHGGFASEEIDISYLDRNYAGNNFPQVLHHEMVHVLDRRLEADQRPSLLVEGLAVYLTGGHYKPEPLMARAAALVDLGWYLPLEPLADDFYNSQHEIGYLEAGALVQFMVSKWGWQAFDDFYRDIPKADSPAQGIDAALQEHLGLTFEQLEGQFLSELRRQHLIPDVREDVRLTVRLYDTVRRYQQALDPSAYFLTAWLPPGKEQRERDIVADLLRHPDDPVNRALETLLVLAGETLRAGEYTQAERVIYTVDRALDAFEKGEPIPPDLVPAASTQLSFQRGEFIARPYFDRFDPERLGQLVADDVFFGRLEHQA